MLKMMDYSRNAAYVEPTIERVYNPIMMMRKFCFFVVLTHVIIYSGYSNEMLELVIFALEDLRKSLKEQGSDLMIRFGRVENVIRELVEEVVTCYICLV